MKALIQNPCTVSCLPGSIVEITEQQFRLLGDAAVEVDEKQTWENTKEFHAALGKMLAENAADGTVLPAQETDSPVAQKTDSPVESKSETGKKRVKKKET